MSTFYIFLQWARPAWLLVIMASAVSVGIALTLLSVIHNWLADQFFILDEAQEDDAGGQCMRTAFEIPVTYPSPDTL